MPETAATPAFSPVAIFLGADFVVQSIVILLALASVAAWSIIIDRTWKLTTEKRQTKTLARAIERIEGEGDLRRICDMSDSAAARVLRSLSDEWLWSTTNRIESYDRFRTRLFSAVELEVSRENQTLTGQTSLLATIGSIAPFVGLFGTVWGIMRSFISIGASQDTSLAVVAPGIAEALMATAIGLACAIPAVIGYNRLLHGMAGACTDWRRLASELEIVISRQFEASAGERS